LGAFTSSATDDWATPLDFYRTLDMEFGFVLDPCSDDVNHKAERYFTREDDGLAQDWSPGPVFMNPPYGRTIAQWVAKAHTESARGILVVGLLPARTDSGWWHRHVIDAKAEARFIRGRLKFGGSTNAAPFPSAVVVWRPR
jgi:site-specific DNA-methyltransferase (adenine-specific)